MSCAIFICHCSIVWPLFDFKISHYLCLSVFCLPSSDLQIHSMIFQIHSIFCLPSSVHTSLHLFIYFCILYYVSMLLCSVSIIIILPFVHYSFPSLPDLNILSSRSLWLCKSSFTFSILHCLPYYSRPCSIKFFSFVPTSLACNCHLPLRKYNPPVSSACLN